MKKQSLLALTILILTFFSHASEKASAAELITNGSFETGNFTGWTVVNASGSWMNWQVTNAGAGGTFDPPYVTAPRNGLKSAWNGVTANANQQYTMTQTITIPAGSTASISWKDRFQMNLSDFCTTAANCGSAFYFVEVLNTSDVVLQTLYTVTAPPLTKTDTGWKNHGAILSAYAGQTIKIRFRDYATVTLAGPGQAEIDSVSVQSPLAPTSANASVGGRVLTFDGQPISRAGVSLMDTSGNIRTAITNPFGYYSFEEVPVGASYVLSVEHKQYSFSDSPRAISVNDDLSAPDFVANP